MFSTESYEYLDFIITLMEARRISSYEMEYRFKYLSKH